MTHTKYTLIAERGARCEICRLASFRGRPIIPILKLARKDATNRERTSENVLLVCAFCFVEHKFNAHHTRQKATRAELSTVVGQE